MHSQMLDEQLRKLRLAIRPDAWLKALEWRPAAVDRSDRFREVNYELLHTERTFE